VLSVPLRCTDSDYPFDIFKFFLYDMIMNPAFGGIRASEWPFNRGGRLCFLFIWKQITVTRYYRKPFIQNKGNLSNFALYQPPAVFCQIVGIPVGTNSTPLIANLFLHCHESKFMAKLQNKLFKNSLISLFNNNWRYLDDILTVNNPNFLTFVKQHLKELTLNNFTRDSCPIFNLERKSLNYCR
jgi:hypothetical protein